MSKRANGQAMGRSGQVMGRRAPYTDTFKGMDMANSIYAFGVNSFGNCERAEAGVKPQWRGM
jgi:hypothetical protein